MTWVVLLVGLLGGSALGAWAALWHRDHIPYGQRQLVIHVYTHVDEVLGATKTEGIRRADRRHKWYRRLWFIPRDGRLSVLNFFWPVPIGGAAAVPALPSYRRIGHYVQIEFTAERRFLKPYQRWNIHAVNLRWTSEASANRDTFLEYLERGRPTQGGGLAQALGLKWEKDMFEVTQDFALARIRFARKAPEPERQPVPTHVPNPEPVDA